MKTVGYLSRAIGQQVMWNVSSDVKVLVTVKDVKQVYGQIRMQIEPVQGVGQQWVDIHSLSGRQIENVLMVNQ